MSHDKVELQRFLSATSNGSFTTTATMSGSGSFSSEPAHHHTDTDTTPNPVYSSIPESQIAHHQYRANQLQRQMSPNHSMVPASAPHVPQPTDHAQTTPQPAASLSDLSNQYDSIPDKHKVRVIDSVPQKRSGNSPARQGGVTAPGMLQAENVLYAGTEDAMRHKTLTMSNTETFKKFRGEASPEMQFEGKEDDHGCRSCALLLWGGCVTALVVVALAGAAVALAILFTGLVDVCSTACKNSDVSSTDDPSLASVQALVDRVNMLEEMVTALNKSVNGPAAESTTASSTVSLATTAVPATMPATMPTNSAMSDTPTSASMGKDVTISLNNVSLYMDCSTSIERSCTIGIGITDTQCLTGFGLAYQRPGEFIMDMSCVRTNTSTEQNGLAFVLSVDEMNNELECLCYVAQLVGTDGTTPTRAAVTCGLRVTRCRTFTSITSDASITP